MTENNDQFLGMITIEYRDHTTPVAASADTCPGDIRSAGRVISDMEAMTSPCYNRLDKM